MVGYRISKKAVFREMEGSIIALNLETGQYYTLDEIGTRMWSLLQELGTIEETVEAMVAEYDVSSEQVEHDLTDLLHKLGESGLVEEFVG